MRFEEILAEVREKMKKADVSGIQGRLAFEFHLTGEGQGTFYAEVKDGVLSIEPYDYQGCDASFTMSSDNFMKMMHNKLNPVAAYMTGKIQVRGDLGKALEIKKLIS